VRSVMKKRIAFLVILIIFTFSSACIFSDWFDMFVKDPDAFVAKMKEDNGVEEDTEYLVGVDDVVTEEPQKEEEAEPPKSEVKLPEQNYFVKVLLDYDKLNEGQKATIVHMWENGTDKHRDYISMIAGDVADNSLNEANLRLLIRVIMKYNHDLVKSRFNNTQFPCDSDIEGGFVVCTDNPLPMEPGNVHVYIMQMQSEIPIANPDYYYTYSIVLDADGDPSNNFQYTEPFDWDFYQNTDRWYILDWRPDMADWTLDVVDVPSNYSSIPSAVRAVVMGDIVAFFIPATEFSVDYPGYRGTAFAHDENFSEESLCGDVSGDNPTEPLIYHIQEEPITVE
jgi:hypothetical protein